MSAPLQDAEIERLLSALGAERASAGCKLVVSLDPPRVLWTNGGARSLFGTADKITLGRTVFGRLSQTRPVTTRLARLEPHSPPSLEGVQISSRFTRSLVVFQCRAVPGHSPKMILMEALSAPSVRDHVPTSGSTRLPAVPDPHPEPRLQTDQRPDQVEPPPAAATPDPAPLPDVVSRFVWRTDPQGLVTQVGTEMQASLGRFALEIGDSLEDRLRALGAPAALAAADAIAARRSWSSPALPWPGDEHDGRATVLLGGTPSPGQGGFRGFGVVQKAPLGLEPAAVAPAAAEQPATAEPAAGEPAPTVENDPAPARPDDPTPSEGVPSDDAGPVLSVTHDTPRDLGRAAADGAPPDALSPLPVSRAPHAPVSAEWRSPRVAAVESSLGSGASKVVHLASFKTGLPGLSGKASIRRDPPQGLEQPAAASLEVPHWAEAPTPAPEAGAPDQRLSSHERFNFDEIARALAALPVGDAAGVGRTAPMGPQERGDKRPDAGAVQPIANPPQTALGQANVFAICDGLAIGVLVGRAGRVVDANRTLLDLAGCADVSELERAGGIGWLLGGEGPGEPQAGDGHPVVLHTRHGSDLRVNVAVQTLAWEGVPATLWSVRPIADTGTGVRVPASGLDLRTGAHPSDLAEALELAASGAGFLDAGGRILSINGGAERLFGYDSRELAGESARKLFAEPDTGWEAFFDRFVSGGAGRTSAFQKATARKRNGDEVPVGVSLRRIGSNRVCIVWQQSVHGHATASEMDLLRRDAERASALKSEFLAKISHEIRTPLNAMLGFTEIIIEERFGPIGNDRYREYLKDIHASGTHVVSLVNDLLDLSRIEAGAVELKLGPVGVNAVAADCVAALQGQAYRDRVIIRMSLAARGPVALADERSLKQIVLNLLSNAVKFNEPGGQVIVSTAISDSGRVIVRVRDTGSGMSDSEIETAMKPFRQLETAKAGFGSGLGLPLTKAMVEACQGNLRIESKPGEGTLVEVTLPRAPDVPLSLPAE